MTGAAAFYRAMAAALRAEAERHAGTERALFAELNARSADSLARGCEKDGQ